MAGQDRLSDLPDSILIHIFSLLQNQKEVVRSSILSTQWRSFWMSVPASFSYFFPDSENKEDTLDYIAFIHRELYYWKSCEKIKNFGVWDLKYDDRYAKDIDLWVHFATKAANVEDFSLGILPTSRQKYVFPEFVYKNVCLKNLILRYCQLNPCGSVHWCSLVSLSIGLVNLTDGVMKKVLSGCPNLEWLHMYHFRGIQRLEISSVKMRKLTIVGYHKKNHDLSLEILAPYIQNLQLLQSCSEICIRQRNVPSLVTAGLHLHIGFKDEERNLENECSYLKELLHCVAHVENLELGAWCIECMSILELNGWHSPPSSRKNLQLSATLNELEFPGFCSFLQSSSDLETLVINWHEYNRKSRELLSRYTNEDEQSRKLETQYFNCSLLHLKTINFIGCFGPPSENNSILPLVRYLLKHATVLEKFVIAVKFRKSDVSQDYVKMEQDILSFPRSSPHASVMFSYSMY